MLNGRLQLATIRQSGSWVRSQSGRLLSGLGFASVLPQVAGAARKDRHREDDQDQKDSDTNENRNEGAGDDTSGKDKNAEAKAENRDTVEKENRSDESENGGGRNRNDNRNGGDDDAQSRAESEEDVSRRESRRQDDSGDSEKAARNNDDDAGDGGGRRTREFEQEVDEVPVEDVPATTPAAPANPNVVITDVPEVSDVDLVVEANPDVIASVSASGGFAFARSGGVTAVTGPDGASIIQTGDVTVDPTEPSDDGGNNDLDFSS